MSIDDAVGRSVKPERPQRPKKIEKRISDERAAAPRAAIARELSGGGDVAALARAFGGRPTGRPPLDPDRTR
jgi:hypothetical protein